MIVNRTTQAVAKLLGFDPEGLVEFSYKQTTYDDQPTVVAAYKFDEYEPNSDIIDLLLADGDDTEDFVVLNNAEIV